MFDMDPLSDYEPQSYALNGFIIINEMRRIICYNQTIYSDLRLEESEFFGLELDFERRTTVRAKANPMYGETAIQILDDDSKQ